MYRLEPSKNYTLFLKATQIDVVMEKLNECLHLHRAHMHELDIYRTVSKIILNFGQLIRMFLNTQIFFLFY